MVHTREGSISRSRLAWAIRDPVLRIKIIGRASSLSGGQIGLAQRFPGLHIRAITAGGFHFTSYKAEVTNWQPLGKVDLAIRSVGPGSPQ